MPETVFQQANPAKKFFLGLEAFGAGLQGKTSLAAKLEKQAEAERSAAFDNASKIFDVTSKMAKFCRERPDEQDKCRESLANIGPEASQLFDIFISDPDDKLLDAFQDRKIELFDACRFAPEGLVNCSKDITANEGKLAQIDSIIYAKERPALFKLINLVQNDPRFEGATTELEMFQVIETLPPNEKPTARQMMTLRGDEQTRAFLTQAGITLGKTTLKAQEAKAGREPISEAAERAGAIAEATRPSLERIAQAAEAARTPLQRIADEAAVKRPSIERLSAEAEAARPALERIRAEAEARRPSLDRLADEANASLKSLDRIRGEAEAKQPSIERIREEAEAARASLQRVADEAAVTRPPIERVREEAKAKRATPEEQAAVVTAKTEAELRVKGGGQVQRRITKAADGFYYYNDGARVFPNIEKVEDQGSRRYQDLGAYVDKETGEFIGEVTFDTRTKERTIVLGGEEQSVPGNAIPITESNLHKNALTGEQFFSLATEIEDTERGLRELTRFMADSKDTRQGWRLLADQFLGHMNTIFGGDLTEEQFKTFASTGRLQGLLGAYRKEVVGGGVMTEQDALRVIARLGGDFDLTRNLDVAAALIRELMNEKLSRYNNLILPMYNGQLTTVDRRGFEAKRPIIVDESVFSVKEPATSPSLPPGFVRD